MLWVWVQRVLGMNKIYTKKGDRGETGTFGGRISNSDQLAIALGTIDELNSWVGLCRGENSNSQIHKFTNQIQKELFKIQTNLMVINSILAGAKNQKIRDSEIKRLEKLIDKLTLELPELKNFIYPVGYLQVARAVARRAEREIVALETKDKNILKYINRLSDALFVVARFVNKQNGLVEETWK